MINDDITVVQPMPEAPLNGRSVLFWFVLLIGVGIIFIGVRFLLQPLSAAAAFGVPVHGTPNFAYLWAKGTRDIVSGLLLLALLWAHAGRRLLALFLAVAALIPLGDLLNVGLNIGTRNVGALAIHGGTVVAMVIISALLFATRAGARRKVAGGQAETMERVEATAH
jgi:hypothetical protein